MLDKYFLINITLYSTFIVLAFLSLAQTDEVSASDFAWTGDTSFRAETIPPRPQKGVSGLEFALQTAKMAARERQHAALIEFRRGNIPEFLRNLKPVRLSYKPKGKTVIKAFIWVMPDYLAVGSDKDFLRMPLDYWTAVEIANEWGFILPTRKMVDAIYQQSTCHLKPEPLPPGPKMRSSEYYLKHKSKIKAQRGKQGCILGELVAGHKKDLVLTNLLNKKQGRVAIYGWHRKSGSPIQPLSTVHGERYADYSHGIRLVYQTIWIDGKPRSILEVLQDPYLAPVLTYEGVIKRLLRMVRLK